MSINATALYPWLQTPTVEKYPPEDKIIETRYTDITVSGGALHTIFDSTSIGGFTNGGILVDVTVYRDDTGALASESSLNFGGYTTNLNGGGVVTHYRSGSTPRVGVIPNNSGSGQYGQKDQMLLYLPLGIRFTSSLVAQLSLDRSGSNFSIVCMAKYYKL
jgi:hypothetical protein